MKNFLRKNSQKSLKKSCLYHIIANVVTLIALKREVAVRESNLPAGFPWSECQFMKTGDKSLYQLKIHVNLDE